jgi:hypothetical protein
VSDKDAGGDDMSRDKHGIPAVMLLAGALALAATEMLRTQSPITVGGSYEGWIRGSSQGDAPCAVTLEQDGATFTGTMTAGPYAFQIVSGRIEGDTLSWNFTTSGIDGTVRATFKAGTITGSWSAAGSESGSLELKTSDAS